MQFATITATYADPQGSGATGIVTLTPLADVSDGLVTVVARPINAPIVHGAASALVETMGATSYRVDEHVDGLAPVSWICPIPSGRVDLADLRQQTALAA